MGKGDGKPESTGFLFCVGGSEELGLRVSMPFVGSMSIRPYKEGGGNVGICCAQHKLHGQHDLGRFDEAGGFWVVQEGGG